MGRVEYKQRETLLRRF